MQFSEILNEKVRAGTTVIKKVTDKSKKTGSRKRHSLKAKQSKSIVRDGYIESYKHGQDELGQAFDLSPHAMAVIDNDLRVLSINPAFSELFEYSKRTIVGTKLTDLLHPDELDETERNLHHLFKGKTGSFLSEWFWLRANGSFFHGKLSASVLKKSETNQQRAFCWIEDVTQAQNNERELKRQVELLDRVEQIAKLGRWEWNIETRQGYWSDEAFRILGRRPQETRPSIDELFRDADLQARAKLQKKIESLIRRGNVPDPIEYQILMPGAGSRSIQLNAEVVRDGRGKVLRIQGTIQDLTERRELELQLQQSQKMESVGLLAGGIAHDFNNLLTVIRGQCELLMRRLGDSSEGRQEAESIESSAEQAQRLTRQLLAFGRKQVLEPRILDLNAEVTRMHEMLSRIIGEHIELLFELDPNLGHVRADAVQIEQVVMNLAINARDAMPTGGRLTIQSANVLADEDSILSREKILPGHYVTLSVEDTGTGMDGDTVARVFEPFFTTKERGSGTGLGLSTVYGIVRQSNGFLSVESEPGLGSVFKVYLPLVNEAIAETPVESEYSGANANGEAILVVEDDVAVRAVARQFLKIGGYQVLEAANGEEALAIVENYSNAIDLVITDVVMPKMSGPELVEKLKTMHPDLRVLFVSGYPGATVAKQIGLQATIPLLQKPYNLKSMTSKVREILSAAKQAL